MVRREVGEMIQPR